jgi:uncharacterized surface protein with fasciclin (FAS1) repeats
MKQLVSIVVAALAALVLGARSSQAADIVDIAASDKNFSTLVAAVKAAGLAETLKGDGPFTVFAPTNAAFAKLPRGTVQNLLKPENKAKLVALLTYHVVPGKVTAADVVKLKNNTPVKSVQGGAIRVRTRPGVMVNNAKVIKTDILADNGVIHVIDTVIMPPMGMTNRSAAHK